MVSKIQTIWEGKYRMYEKQKVSNYNYQDIHLMRLVNGDCEEKRDKHHILDRISKLMPTKPLQDFSNNYFKSKEKERAY